jgi:hypothetical protein
MLVSIAKTIWALSVLVSMVRVQVHAQDLVFELLWKYPKGSAPSTAGMCDPTFQHLNDFLYIDYVEEIMAESSLTESNITAIDPDWDMIDYKPWSKNKTKAKKPKTRKNFMLDRMVGELVPLRFATTAFTLFD